MTFYTPWQGAHGDDVLGHGPDHMGAGGCVVSTAAMIRAELRPDLTRMSPSEVNAFLRGVPGAFVDGSKDAKPGDLFDWPVAAPALGLRVEDNLVRGTVDEDTFARKIEDTFAAGGRLAVRVAIHAEKPNEGNHTIAGLRLGVGLIVCGCSALATTIPLFRPALENTSIKWNGNPRPYCVVAIRPVFASSNA